MSRSRVSDKSGIFTSGILDLGSDPGRAEPFTALDELTAGRVGVEPLSRGETRAAEVLRARATRLSISIVFVEPVEGVGDDGCDAVVGGAGIDAGGGSGAG